MSFKTAHLCFCLALVPALALASGCGQKASFTDKESTRSDTNGATGGAGGVDTTPGSANAQPANGGTGTAPNGSDSTTGDFPGGDKGGGDDSSTDEKNVGNTAGGGTGGGGTAAGNGTGSGGTGNATGNSTGGGSGTGGATGGQTGGAAGGSTGDLPGNDGKHVTTDQTFNATTTANGSVTKTLDASTQTQEITMVRNYSAKNVAMQQVVRPAATDTFTQGHPGAAKVETFNQTANRPLDIVAVTDDSESMGDQDPVTGETKQQKVATRVADLLSSLGDTDWQIGVVTTDPSEGSLRGLIKKGDADVATEFANAWNAGTSSSDNERGILQSVRSLAGYNLPAPWVRPNSTVAVLIVSDEDNCSAGSQPDGPGAHQNNCPGKDYATAPYLVNYLASIREIGKTARVYGIIWGPDQTQAQCPLGFNQGIEYAQAITATGGVWGSICDQSYAPTLQKISQDVQTALISNFTLSFVPDPSSVTVTVGTTQLAAGQFTVAGNTVSLATPPPTGATITVSYTTGAVPEQTSFALSAAPLPTSVAVTVNGNPAVLGTDYTLDANAPAVDFTTAPAASATIVVTYKKDVALATQFNLNDVIKPGTLAVTVNGSAVAAGADYTENDATGLVTFVVPPAEGAALAFAYTEVGAPVLAYPFTTPAGAPQDLAATDAQTMAPIAVTYTAGAVLVAQSDWQEGRQMVLRFDNAARNTFEVDLPQMPLAGSVKATDGQTTCDQAPQLAVNGQVVDVEGCAFAFADNQVAVDYTYVAQQLQDFDFTAAAVPAATVTQVWTVWVNGTVSTDYTRTGGHFHFTNPLPIGAVVKIELIQEVN